ncbi:YoaK family protein [Erythrobacter sp. EC-HK427]|uniref:YoaK family protein n=1 Tax=Erythrobacter sp. EC-HK427 TaxID=2038396 RepID=UPI00125FCED9|nr:YoaK family protein [Erythrobacter sp. EC-HK427]
MKHLDTPRRWLAIGLAGLAGFVDATGFLATGGYFASFMSGNTTRLGVDLSGNPAMAIWPAAIIALFVIGVAAGAIASDRGGTRRKSAVLALAVALLVIAALFDGNWLPGFLAASVLAMGALNNVFRRDGEVTVGVTYMTGALVRFGQGLAAWLTGKRMSDQLTAIGLWFGLAAGAVTGAVAFSVVRGVTPWLAVGYAVLLLAAAFVIERRLPQPGS